MQTLESEDWVGGPAVFLNTAARFCLLVAISYLKNPILLGGVFLFLFFLRAFLLVRLQPRELGGAGREGRSI